jgi:DnaJ-class molecular chaperone
MFQKIGQAYETLGDDYKREEYNQSRSNPFFRMNSHRGGGGMDMDVDDIFKAFFGGGVEGDNGFPGFPFPMGMGMGPGGFSASMGPGGNIHVFSSRGRGGGFTKPTPIIKNVEITIEQVLSGSTIPLIIERWIIQNNNKVFENETLYIEIPKGIDDNEIIILRDKGNTMNDSIKGDVKIFIKINNNTLFQRSGLDLFLSKTISLKDSLCGFTFELKYLNGKTYTLNCNSGNIIHPGYKKILPNMGITREAQSGNLIIDFQVEFPEKITEEQILQLRNIL